MRIVLAFAVAVVVAQAPVDVTKIGPQVGATVADFTLKDQRGQDHTLSKAAGTKGTMLVFFRSADW